MKRVTLDITLNNAQVEAAQLKSTRVGKAGTFDARGLRGAGLVDVEPHWITIREVVDVPGPLGVESWEGLEAVVADTRVIWCDSVREQEELLIAELRNGRSARFVSHPNPRGQV